MDERGVARNEKMQDYRQVHNLIQLTLRQQVLDNSWSGVKPIGKTCEPSDSILTTKPFAERQPMGLVLGIDHSYAVFLALIDCGLRVETDASSASHASNVRTVRSGKFLLKVHKGAKLI
jgi:hypothetical protein